jgi:propionyl-CoA carboxylase alpha chain
VFCEPLLSGARHIEVQVVADAHGSVWALTERDCSVQRRYQKVIEETPSPAVGPRLREQLLAAAAAVTRAVGYRGAGTTEFLVDSAGQFFFLEFNTRLQVEHPVTECVHGIDLVALQLDVAQGIALPSRPPPPSGHAIEARLYAEDPADGYRPAIGTVRALAVPEADTRFAPPASQDKSGLRLDSGVEAGSEVSPHYDPMLAKLIAWAPARETAARMLASALDRATIHGPATNRDLLTSVLRDPVFLAGQADTSLLERYDLTGLVPGEQACRLSAVAAALAGAAANRSAAGAVGGLPSGWRNVVSQPQRTAFDGPRGRIEVAYRWQREGITATPDENSGTVEPNNPEVIGVTGDHAVLEVSGVHQRFEVARAEGVVWVDSSFGHVVLTPVPRLPEPAVVSEPGSLVAPMPGNVVRIGAERGERVRSGRPILVLEAMKMEHQIEAPADGVVAEVRVAVGDQVQAGDVLAIVDPERPRGGEADARAPGNAEQEAEGS